MADRTDGTGSVQPARVAGPAGARDSGRRARRGDCAGLQSRRHYPGGRVLRRRYPVVGPRLARPGQHGQLGGGGKHTGVHRQRQDPGRRRPRCHRHVEPGQSGQDRRAPAGRGPGGQRDGIQPGRQDRGHRRRRRKHPAVECRHQPGDRRADELGSPARGRGVVQPGRRHGGRCQHGRDGPAVGRRHRAGGRPRDGGQLSRGQGADIQPRRDDPGHRRRRRERPAVDGRHPDPRPARSWRPGPPWPR